MGLDMYLSARKYLSEYSNRERAQEVRALFPEIRLTDNLNSVNVDFEVGYWRKANHIHKWFVDNIQDGNDDCGRYMLFIEQLLELKKLCESVITTLDKCKKLDYDGEDSYYTFDIEETGLPPVSGFFFGSTNYDKWYHDSLGETIEIIDYCVELSESGYEFEYSSSW